MFLLRIKSNKFYMVRKSLKKNLKIIGEISFLNKGYKGNQSFYNFMKSMFGFRFYWFTVFSTLFGLRKESTLGLLGIFLLKIEQISLKHFQLRLYLKKSIRDQINFHKEQRTYAGMRHLLGLPVRGQRTHTNHKTIKKLEPRTILIKSRRQERRLINKKGKK